MSAIILDWQVVVVLAGMFWVIVFSWLVSIVLTLFGLARQKRLLPVRHSPASTDTPLVSILVPARNEQHRVLENCIHSILVQDYPRFEVIAVNDRSTDSTSAILDALAKAINGCG